MTTGSFGPGYYEVGPHFRKSWNGVDRTGPKRSEYADDPMYETSQSLEHNAFKALFGVGLPSRAFVDKDDGTYRDAKYPGMVFKKRGPASRPPKRDGKEEWHTYGLTSVRAYSGLAIRPDLFPDVTTYGIYAPLATNGGVKTLLDDNNDLLKLFGKVREKVQGSDFNASVFLGEGHQVLKMMATTATKIARAVRYTRSGNVGMAIVTLTGDESTKVSHRTSSYRRATQKTASARWLELQYGWMPLLKDFHAGAQFIGHKLSSPFVKHLTVRQRRKEFLTGSYSFVGFDQIATHDRILHIWIRENPGLAVSLGILDPEQVAWELVPLSFVYDWFVPFGQYLEARAAVSSLNATYAISDFKRATTTANGSYSGPYRWIGPRSNSELVSYSRGTLSTYLQPPLPRYKGLDKSMSVAHCLNAIALVGAAASGLSVGTGVAKERTSPRSSDASAFWRPKKWKL